jgi:splicing factor 3B subunit 3
MLTYYELDLGLNHVVRKWATEIPKSSHHLISVPDKLVCYENFLLYKNQGHPDVIAPIPQRFRNDGNYKRGLMIVTSSTIKTKVYTKLALLTIIVEHVLLFNTKRVWRFVQSYT